MSALASRLAAIQHDGNGVVAVTIAFNDLAVNVGDMLRALRGGAFGVALNSSIEIAFVTPADAATDVLDGSDDDAGAATTSVMSMTPIESSLTTTTTTTTTATPTVTILCLVANLMTTTTWDQRLGREKRMIQTTTLMINK